MQREWEAGNRPLLRPLLLHPQTPSIHRLSRKSRLHSSKIRSSPTLTCQKRRRLTTKIRARTQKLSLGLLLSLGAELSSGSGRQKKSKPKERRRTKRPQAVSSVRASDSTTRQPPKVVPPPSSARKATCCAK